MQVDIKYENHYETKLPLNIPLVPGIFEKNWIQFDLIERFLALKM